MSEEHEVDLDELEDAEGEALPDREAMSIVDLDGGMSPPFFDEPPKYGPPPDPVDSV